MTNAQDKLQALENKDIIKEKAEQRPYEHDTIVPRSNISDGADSVCINGDWYHIVFRGIVNDIVKGKAPIIVINGKGQTGKSTLGMYIADVLHNRINCCGGDWNPERNLCYDVTEYFSLVRDYIREVVAVDEAGKNLNSKDWYTALNRANDITLETMSVMEHVHMYISTHFSDLDTSIKKRDCYHFYPVKAPGTPDNLFKVDKRIVNDSSKNWELEKTVDLGTIKVSPSQLPDPDLITSYRKKEYNSKLGEYEQVLEEAEAFNGDSQSSSNEDSW